MIGAFAALILLELALAFLYWRPRIELSAQGRGEPSGFWALAFGVEALGVALSGAAAQGVEGAVQVHLLGRKVFQRSFKELLGDADEKPEEDSPSLKTLQERYQKFNRWLAPSDVGLFALEELRRIHIRRLELELTYSFQNIGLTGRTSAALYVISGIVPEPIVIRHQPSWELRDQGSFELSGRIEVSMGWLVVDSVRFVVTNLKLRKQKPAVRGATETS